jgi:hypothetical protein
MSSTTSTAPTATTTTPTATTAPPPPPTKEQLGDQFATLILEYVLQTLRGEKPDKKNAFEEVKKLLQGVNSVNRKYVVNYTEPTKKYDYVEFLGYSPTAAQQLATPLYYVIKYAQDSKLVKLLLVNQARCEDAFQPQDRLISIGAMESNNAEIEKIVYYAELYCKNGRPFTECSTIFPRDQVNEYIVPSS